MLKQQLLPLGGVARLLLFISLLCVGDSASMAQTIVDLEPTPRSSRPADFVVVNDLLFFSAGTPDRVLWVQQGTSQPTAVPNSPTEPFALGVLGNDLILAGRSDELGFELYRSDGSTVTLLSDLNPGSASSLATEHSKSAVFGNYVYFVADDGTSGFELYRTDGLVVEFVGDVNQGFDGSGFRSSFPGNFFAGDTFLFYSATNRDYGTELYRTDGASPLRFDINETGSSNPNYFVNHKGRVYFVAETDTLGRELLRVGVSGPELAQDIRPGLESSDPVYATEVGDVTVFFANDGATGHEPWVLYDDTTRMIADLRPGREPSISYGLPQSVKPVAVDGYVYFVADDGVTGRELWRTDGTDISQVGDLRTGTEGSNPSSLVAASDRLYFYATGDAGPALYSCDRQSVERHPGTLQPAMFYDDRPYGSVDDVAIGNELGWYELGEQILVDLVSGTNDSNAGELLAADEQLMLVASVQDRGRLVYSFADDELVAVFASGDATYSNPENLTPGPSGTVYFSAIDSVHGNEIWVASGTTAELLGDINPGAESSDARSLTVVGDVLFFSALGGVFGREVWIADSASVRRVADIFPGSGDLDYHAPQSLTAYNNRLYFSHNDGFHRLLFTTDGQTVDAVDATRRNAARNPTDLLVAGPTLYFVATSDDAGFELWKTNGTTTERVSDIADGRASSNPSNLSSAGSTVFFAADDGQFGRELWKTDGTNTVRLTDINPAGDSNPWSIATIDDAQYFLATDGSQQSIYRHGDGTIESVVDVTATVLSPMVAFDKSLFFVAEDAARGSELWRLDPSGILTVTDAMPGPAGSNPHDLVVVKNRLYFVAIDPNLGVELHYVVAVIETGNDDDETIDLKDGGDDALILFPNPTTSLVTIKYELAETGNVAVQLFDVLGRHRTTVSNAVETAGARTLEISVDDLANGQYFVVVQTPGQRYTSRFVVSR